MPTIGSLAVPVEGVAETAVCRTTSECRAARLGRVDWRNKDADEPLVLRATVRYIPDDEDAETDRYGYAETEFLDVMRFVGLSDEQQKEVRRAVQHALRDKTYPIGATSTRSVRDRLRMIRVNDAPGEGDATEVEN